MTDPAAESVAAVLAALIPANGDLPSGAVAAPALLADPEIAALLAGLDHTAGPPLEAWQALADSDPHGAAAALHVLSAAYFADPRVRAHYRLDAVDRPAERDPRLADLLATVPPAPRLPER